MNTGSRLPVILVALFFLVLIRTQPAPAQQQGGTVETSAGTIAVTRLAEGLEHPWGMAFLPDGRLLVTERAGRLRILGRDNVLSPPLEGVPEVFAEGQGGLLDVALDPDFDENSQVYLSFAEAGEEGASTAVGRGTFEGSRITGFEVIFRQQPKVEGSAHFGGRIVFSPDDHLFLTMGERFKFEPAQDPANHLGAIVRINSDGSVPADNPFYGRPGARDEIWTFGHRNIQAAAFQPETGDLWVGEMGPEGGDELNLIEPGNNYGWPVVSWGSHYGGRSIPSPTTQPRFADSRKHWTPVISPSGMIFYTGEMFPQWQGDALIGGLTSQELVRVEFNESKIEGEERIPMGARIRDVEQAPDGSVYLLTDKENGEILRLSHSSQKK